ncbi:hypothetical protein Cgig2_020218 [Carnegiea gigantea]|uniref:Cyclin-like domain-containing protein n=1 Tax=Carnegiea gigantea TaxID=171969 RepID=A0A9Q1KTD8_9CARY|nr:hypothetical protein Cgig2_020218 [Carnegiea gigantea]
MSTDCLLLLTIVLIGVAPKSQKVVFNFRYKKSMSKEFDEKLFNEEKERCIKSATQQGHKHLKLVQFKSDWTDVFLQKVVIVADKDGSAEVLARSRFGIPVTILRGSWTDLKQLSWTKLKESPTCSVVQVLQTCGEGVFDYMPRQSHSYVKARMILVDWLVEVRSYKFELLPEILYLAIDLIDPYLSKKVVRRKELQLVGIASMLSASKCEEIWAAEVNVFICMSDNAYTHEQILAMEKQVLLRRWKWNLTVRYSLCLSRWVHQSHRSL